MSQNCDYTDEFCGWPRGRKNGPLSAHLFGHGALFFMEHEPVDHVARRDLENTGLDVSGQVLVPAFLSPHPITWLLRNWYFIPGLWVLPLGHSWPLAHFCIWPLLLGKSGSFPLTSQRARHQCLNDHSTQHPLCVSHASFLGNWVPFWSAMRFHFS